MSKLIRDEELDNTSKVAPVLLPLSNSAVVSHLKACQNVAADYASTTFKHYLKLFDEALGVEMSHAKSNQDATELGEVQRLFRANSEEMLRYYCGYLSEGFVKFKKHQLNTVVGNDLEDNVDQLSLVGNEQLEEAIAITSLTQRADSYFAEPLWALNQRFAVLNGGEHVTESSNPASPIQLCESLRKSLKLVPLSSKIKTLAYKVFDTQLLSLSRHIIDDINQYLKSQGVLPHLKYTLPSGGAPASYLSDDDGYDEDQDFLDQHSSHTGLPSEEDVSPEEYQHNLVDAIRQLQDQLLAPQAQNYVPTGQLVPAHPGHQPPPGAITVTEEDLISALQILQHETQQTTAVPADWQPMVPVDISTVVEQLKEQLEAESKEGVVENNDMQTIDLVGLLFEYMLSDEHLPDSIKAVLSYLHTPFLKIAFIDPGFFEQMDHPARLLLNNLAEAGARWVGNDGTSQYNIYDKIKDVVNKVLSDFDNDVKVITTLLLEFSSYTKNIIRRQELMEKRATEKAQGEEKLREVKLRVNDEIRGRTEHRELPSAVLLFLFQPWSDYLSFALLRYGEQSEKWVKALALVDDVLWCIDLKTKDADRTRQIEMHDVIIRSIEAGFETIGFEQAKGKKLLDALSSLIKLAVQSKKAEPAPAPMRDKLERIAAEKAGSKPVEEEHSPEEAQMVESLKMIEFGTWFEFSGGKRLKVAWYNARTSHYMLVDQMGKRVDMMSGLDMAKQMIAGTAKIISGSSKPFFERALENIFHKLNEKAEANKSTGAVDVVE